MSGVLIPETDTVFS